MDFHFFLTVSQRHSHCTFAWFCELTRSSWASNIRRVFTAGHDFDRRLGFWVNHFRRAAKTIYSLHWKQNTLLTQFISGLCKVSTGWRRMADGGWRIEKCGWKIANDTMQMIKSLWGKINLKCIWQNFFLFARLNLPNVLLSVAKRFFFPIAIFLSRVLMYQKHQISLPVGYKTARPKTGDWERLWRQFRTPSLAKNRFLRRFLIFS